MPFLSSIAAQKRPFLKIDTLPIGRTLSIHSHGKSKYHHIIVETEKTYPKENYKMKSDNKFTSKLLNIMSSLRPQPIMSSRFIVVGYNSVSAIAAKSYRTNRYDQDSYKKHELTFKNIQEHSRTFKNIQEHPRTFKDIQGHSRTFKNIQGHSRTFKNIQEHFGGGFCTLSRTLRHAKNSDIRRSVHHQ